MCLIVTMFCIMVVLSFFVDTEIPLFVYIIAAFLALDEIAVFLKGYFDGRQDEARRKSHKDYRRK